jgi:hypothetical protein
MPQTSRTFRIFVSSTFSDLKAERNALGEVARCLGSSMHPPSVEWRIGLSPLLANDPL